MTERLAAWLLWVLAVHPALVAQTFVEAGPDAGISGAALDPKEMAGGLVWFDFNNDYYPDLLLLNGVAPPKLYRNDWDGSFTDVTVAARLGGMSGFMGGVSADFDDDGWADLLLTTQDGMPGCLLKNSGAGTFVDVSLRAGITHIAYGASATVGDPDNDGDPDIYVANYLAGEEAREGGQPNFLYRNDGNMRFTEVAAAWGVNDTGCGLGATFTDLDNDGREDLYLANDFGYLVKANELFRNDSAGYRRTAARDGTAATINAMGIAKGDYDNDGDTDLYVTNIRENPLFENVAGGRYFNYAAQSAGVDLPDLTSWGTSFADFDLDGNLDLVVANGEITESVNEPEPLTLFRNLGNGRFADHSAASGLADVRLRGRGLAVADYDLDGWPDVAVNAVQREDRLNERARLLRNQGKINGNWLAVAVPLGARTLRLHLSDRVLLREVDGGSSYLSHAAVPVHFGAAASAGIDSLTVAFGDGSERVYRNLPWNRLLGIREDGSWYRIDHATEFACAGNATEPIVTEAWSSSPEGRETLTLTRRETEAYERLPPEVIELRSGEIFRGLARTQDASLVDTLDGSGGCPRLRPLQLRILPARRQAHTYPNPVVDRVTVELPNSGGSVRADVFDAAGKLVFTYAGTVPEGAYRTDFSLRQLPRGIYVCRLLHGAATSYHKLIRP